MFGYDPPSLGLNLTESARAGLEQTCAPQNRDFENGSTAEKKNEEKLGRDLPAGTLQSMHEHADTQNLVLTHTAIVTCVSFVKYMCKQPNFYDETTAVIKKKKDQALNPNSKSRLSF